MNYKLLLIGIICMGSLRQPQAQVNIPCDSIQIFTSNCAGYFKQTFNSVTADSILAISHTSSSWGCHYTLGVICWKKGGDYNFRLLRNKKIGRYRSSRRLNKALKLHLIQFFEKQLYLKTEKIEKKTEYWIDDGPYTSIWFTSPGYCWKFSFPSIISKDERAVWANKFIRLVKK